VIKKEAEKIFKYKDLMMKVGHVLYIQGSVTTVVIVCNQKHLDDILGAHSIKGLHQMVILGMTN
jgi:hypothetical protein